MEETILRVCLLLASLLTLKDPTIFQEEDDIVVDMETGENLLLKEEAILEQDVPSVHSAAHQRLLKEEYEKLNLQLSGKEEKPQEQKMQPEERQSNLHHVLATEDRHYELETGKTLDRESQAPNVDNADSLTDKNIFPEKEIQPGGQNETNNQVLSAINERGSQEDAVLVQTKEVPIDQKELLYDMLVSSASDVIADNSPKDLNQVEMTDKQTLPKESTEISQGHNDYMEHQTSFFQRAVNGLIRGWFQASQDLHTESDNKSFEEDKPQQLQDTHKTEEMARIDERLSEVHQGHSSNAPSNADLSSLSQEQETTKGPENVYIWYLWKVLSLVSLIRLLRKFISKNSKISGTSCPLVTEGKNSSGTVFQNISTRISLLDNKVLSCFYEQCVKIPLGTHEHTCDFVEGFVDELLEAARNNVSKDMDLQIGESVGVGSMYELWATGKTMVFDLYVPLTLSHSFSFDFELDMPKYGKIKMVKAERTSNGCPCANGVADDDMLCLLHSHNEINKIMDAVDGPLCQENTPYLSRTQVVQWFRKTISKAWQENSHKYEFELAFRNQAAPVALRVRLRSGQVILFNLTPVVQVQGSEIYLLPYFPMNQATNFTDTHWPVSLAKYEMALLKHFNESLPNNSCHISCLQILAFLHKQQNILTGNCGLKTYHLKITLLHLLLASKPEDWDSKHLAYRLADMLTFLAQRLQNGNFYHALVKNPLVPSNFGLPEEVQSANPTNLFLPLLSDRSLYLRTVEHLQELVKNAPVLIQEYVSA